MNYYETQLKETLRDFDRYPGVRVKFQGEEASTNWLTLNAESAAAIIAALREQFGVVSEPHHQQAQKEPRYLHFMTGSVDTREGWISSYLAEELENHDLTAEEAFAKDVEDECLIELPE